LKSSNSPRERVDRILVGKVVGAHGIRGNIKVHSFAESKAVFETGEGIAVGLPDGSSQLLKIVWVQPHGKGLLMHLESVTDRDQAEKLVGANLFADKASLPSPEEDTYYWFDLIGLQVVDTAGTVLGRLDSIIPTPGNDIYVVKGRQDQKPGEMLIPAVGDVVLAIDLENGTMVVDPPEGL